MADPHVHRAHSLSGPSGVARKLRATAIPLHSRESTLALTGVRFPLAIWVVLHHIAVPGRLVDSVTSALPFLQTFVGAAWAALGVFFCISGFVLTLRYRAEHWTADSVKRYAGARFARVYPLYLLSLLVLAPIIAAAVRRGEVGGAAESARLVANYVLILQGWAKLPVDWNTPAWSLSCEMFYYACFPLLIPMMRRLSWRRVGAVALLAIAIAVAVRLAGVPTTVKPAMYAGDFTIGMAIAGAYELLGRRDSRLCRKPYLLYGPGMAVFLGLPYVAEHIPFLVFDNVLRVGVAAAVLGLAFGCRAFATRAMVIGGNASYAIYILHVPVLWWYKRTPAYLSLPPAQADLIYLAGVVAVALLASRWVEQPAEAFLRRKLRPAHAPAP